MFSIKVVLNYKWVLIVIIFTSSITSGGTRPKIFHTVENKECYHSKNCTHTLTYMRNVMQLFTRCDVTLMSYSSSLMSCNHRTFQNGNSFSWIYVLHWNKCEVGWMGYISSVNPLVSLLNYTTLPCVTSLPFLLFPCSPKTTWPMVRTSLWSNK